MIDDVPTEQEFRDSGKTANAINYPLSEAGFKWLCKFNGISPEQAPRSWKYASNEYMLKYIEAQARK